MDSHELKKYIERPDYLKKEQSEELQRLIKQYPYCSTLHLLFLKSLYNSNNEQYSHYLSQSAPFIHNREHFYKWVHKATFTSKANYDSGEDTKKIPENKSPFETQEEREARLKDELRQIEKEKDYQDYSKDNNSETTQYSTSQEKNDNPSDLIDQFINNEPKIIPDKESDFKEETQKADSSIQDNQEFISETLAQIYQRQGKINKAIEIYEKLSLKFPKKKRYFANLIQELKNNQQSNN
ncbi:MAG: hypothetical protein K9I29_04270 [Bacteroidales bacterium]|nr:hypothetical protein [Bacteroidales bacterium]MCF8327488.1 hypothetical protein [Bacteroidales bacterium]